MGVHPGVIASTPDKGARQLVWPATATPGHDWQSGTYYENGRPAHRLPRQARDLELARGLWERSTELVGPPVR